MIPSRLKILGHPVHPMLIPLPIAFFSGALLTDLLYAFTGEATWYVVATWMLVFGAAGAVMAAVAGLVDYVQAIPATAPAKNVATLHLLANSIATVLFLVSMALHLTGDSLRLVWIVVALDTAGFLCLLVGGWLGGELVYRHHVGIEPSAVAEQNERARRVA